MNVFFPRAHGPQGSETAFRSMGSRMTFALVLLVPGRGAAARQQRRPAALARALPDAAGAPRAAGTPRAARVFVFKLNYFNRTDFRRGGETKKQQNDLLRSPLCLLCY